MSRRGRRGRRYADADGLDAEGWSQGFEMILHIPGVPGDSELESHREWINVLAWSWGMSRSQNESKKPARILAAIAAKKKEIAKQAIKKHKELKQAEKKKKNDTNQTATTMPTITGAAEIENKSGDAVSKLQNGDSQDCTSKENANGTVNSTPASNPDEEEDSNENDAEIAEAALANYDSDNDEDNQFDDSELKRVHRSKPHIQNFSLTKYVDISSPLIMMKCFSKEPSFDCTFRVCKRKEVRKSKAETDSDTKTNINDEKSGEKNEKRTNGSEVKEEEKEFEAVVIEEFLLQDCSISSVSTGGSGGEDRLTENITIEFSRFVRTYKDYLGFAPRGARGEVPTKTIYFDSIRNKGMALDQAVANAIEDQRKLAPVSTVLMDYLNLRSKPNSAAAR